MFDQFWTLDPIMSKSAFAHATFTNDFLEMNLDNVCVGVEIFKDDSPGEEEDDDQTVEKIIIPTEASQRSLRKGSSRMTHLVSQIIILELSRKKLALKKLAKLQRSLRKGSR